MAEFHTNEIDGVTFFNLLRDDLSPTFQERIPQATRDNFAAIGTAMQSADYEPQFNEWITALINRIGLVLIDYAAMTNPLAPFKKGRLEMGQDIEDIHVDIIEGQSFEPIANVASDPFPIWPGDVKTMYHRLDRRQYYPITIRAEQIRSAFIQMGGMNRLIDYMINQMYNSAELDEWIFTKQLFTEYVDNPAVPLLPDQNIIAPLPIDEATGTTFYQAIQTAVMQSSFPSRAFNPMKVMQRSTADSLYLFLRADILPVLNTRVLSAAFNQNRMTQTIPTIIPMDDFGDGTLSKDVLGILAPSELLMIYDTWVKRTGNIENPRGLYINYYYHVWQLYALKYFSNCFIITADRIINP